MFGSRKKIITARPGNGAGVYQHGNQKLIELRFVTKAYETAAGDFVALKNVNLGIDRGEFVAVVGKSGSGKSTLINMITGIDRPTAGEVLVGDTAVHTLSEGQMAVWRGRHVGVIFQFFQLLPTLTVLENVMLPMDFCNTYPARERPGTGAGAAGRSGHGGAGRQAASGHIGRPAAASCHRPGHGQRPRPSSWPTNRPAISTRAPPRLSSSSSLGWWMKARRC